MKGVLDRQYFRGRMERPEYVFRYKTRSLIVHYAVSKFLRTPAKPCLLDFGAADGLNLLELNDILTGEWALLGIEYSTELVAEAPELPLNVTLSQGDITQPVEVQGWGQCDVVSALAVLEHLKSPIEAVKNAAAVLKSGGIFVATSPVPFWDWLSSRLGLLKGDQHESDIDRRAMIICLHAAGFKVEELGKFMWAPIAFLPYFGIRVSPAISLKVDAFVGKLKVFNFLFVNQYVVGRKP